MSRPVGLTSVSGKRMDLPCLVTRRMWSEPRVCLTQTNSSLFFRLMAIRPLLLMFLNCLIEVRLTSPERVVKKKNWSPRSSIFSGTARIAWIFSSGLMLIRLTTACPLRYGCLREHPRRGVSEPDPCW